MDLIAPKTVDEKIRKALRKKINIATEVMGEGVKTMDIKYEIEPVFKIEFFKIKCIDFKNKKKKLEKVLARYPEMPQANFSSNRNKCSINTEF